MACFFDLYCARVSWVTYWRSMSFYLRERFCSILTQACGRLPYDLPISFVFSVGGCDNFCFFAFTLKAPCGCLFVRTPYPRVVFSLHFEAFITVWLTLTDHVDESGLVLGFSFLAKKYKLNANFV